MQGIRPEALTTPEVIKHCGFQLDVLGESLSVEWQRALLMHLIGQWERRPVQQPYPDPKQMTLFG